MSKKHPTGFTIVEVIVVLAIIGILAVLTISISKYVFDKGYRETARVQIDALQSLLEIYKVDQGAYPLQSDGDAQNSTYAVIDALQPTTPGAKIYPIPLRMFNSYRAGLDEATIRANAQFLIDPFGNPYHYQYEGGVNRSGKIAFDLWSQGSKNSSDPALWIKNW
jgi:prepilin-type N-terminal cleavage/methylation domain-containing protein